MATRRQDLFVSIGAGLDNSLTTASKAAKTALLSIGDAAGDVQEEVRRAFADLGKSNGLDSLKEVERSSKRTFDAIQRNLREVLTAAPDQQIRIFDAAAAEQAAAAAERAAAQARFEADAAGKAALKNDELSRARRVVAATAEAAAIRAEKNAIALRNEAIVIADVAREAGTYVSAQNRITAVNGATRAGMQQLGFQLNDVAVQFAASTPPMIIFAQQSGQIIQAISLMTGEAKGFLGFLGGPWGIGITTAVTVLIPLVAKLLEESDASKEARKAAEAHEKAIDSLIEAQKREVQTADEQLRAKFLEVAQRRENAIATRQETAALIEQARARLSAAERIGDAGSEGGINVGETVAGTQEREIARLEALQATNDRQIAELTAATNRAAGLVVSGIVDANSTPEGRARRQFDLARRTAEIDFERTGDAARYAATRRRLNDAEEAEIKRLQEGQRAARGANRQAGREIDLADARRIVESIGGTVTSGLRTRAEQERLYERYKAGKGPLAAKPGTSDHEAGHAVDVAKGPGITLDRLVRAFQAQGVRVTQKLDEGSHYHIAFGQKGRSAEQRQADAEARKAETERLQKERELERSLVQLTGAYDPAAAEVARFREELEAIVELGRTGRISPIQQAEFTLLSGAASRERQSKIAADRTPDFVKQGAAEFDQIVEGLNRGIDDRAEQLGDRSPLHEYLRSLREASEDVDGALQEAAINGFGRLEDEGSRAAAAAISDLLGIGGVAGQVINGIIADLARLAIQKAIVAAIGSSFLGFADGGPIPGFAGGGLVFGAGGPRDDKVLARLSPGEFVINAAAAKRLGLPLLSALNDNQLPGFADGGLVAPAGAMPRVPSIRDAERGVYGRRERLVVEGDIKVSPTGEFDARMEGLAVRTVSAAADPIATLAESRTRRGLARPALASGW